MQEFCLLIGGILGGLKTNNPKLWPLTIETLKANIAKQLASFPSPNMETLLKFISVLADEFSHLQPQPNPQPSPDLVATLRAEITDLKIRLALLDGNEKIIEETRTVLRQREDADLGNQTAIRLPNWALIIMTELDNLRKQG